MKCSIEGCPGEYEEQKIVHTVRHHGQVIVIDQVPAEVCSVCAILWTLFKRLFGQIPSAVGRGVIFLANSRPSRR